MCKTKSRFSISAGDSNPQKTTSESGFQNSTAELFVTNLDSPIGTHFARNNRFQTTNADNPCQEKNSRYFVVLERRKIGLGQDAVL